MDVNPAASFACIAFELKHPIASRMACACCIRSSACASVKRPLFSRLVTVAMNVFIVPHAETSLPLFTKNNANLSCEIRTSLTKKFTPSRVLMSIIRSCIAVAGSTAS